EHGNAGPRENQENDDRVVRNNDIPDGRQEPAIDVPKKGPVDEHLHVVDQALHDNRQRHAENPSAPDPQLCGILPGNFHGDFHGDFGRSCVTSEPASSPASSPSGPAAVSSPASSPSGPAAVSSPVGQAA